jgi:hypothetical protein
VATDLAPVLANVILEVLSVPFHHTQRYANYRVECDHGRLNARLRPMRGLKSDGTARVIIRGHAFLQSLGGSAATERALPCAPLTQAAQASGMTRNTPRFESVVIRMLLQVDVGHNEGLHLAGCRSARPCAPEPKTRTPIQTQVRRIQFQMSDVESTKPATVNQWR